MKKGFLAILAALLFAGVVSAQYDGQTADGYTFSGGLWYYPGYSIGYTRTLVTTPGYWSGHCYVRGSSYYHYRAVQLQVAPYVPPVPTYTKDWKTDVLKYKEHLNDLTAFQETMRGLGINTGTYSAAYQAPRTSTNYGFSLQSVSYGDFNPLLLHQAHAQSVQQALKLGESAVAGQKDLIDADADNRVRIIEAQTKAIAVGQAGEAIAKIIRATQPNGSSITTKIDGSTVAPVAGTGQQIVGDVTALQNVMGAKCAQCHSGNVLKGGIDLSLYLKFSDDTKRRVRRAVMWNNPDQKLRMPPDGPLPMAEMELFFRN